MRIVHLCLAGTITDGWSYQENLLAKYHKKNGHDVSIVTSEWVYNKLGKLEKSNANDYFLQDGTHVIRLKIKNKDNLKYRFKRYENITETLEKLNPEILFIHGCQFLDITEIKKYVKKHKTRLYIDNHADFSNSATSWISKNILHKIIWKYGVKKIAPYVKKFYGVLPARVDFLHNIYGLPKDKCELLVMGADDDLVALANTKKSIETTRVKYGIKENDFLIVTGGKIDSAKTQTILLMEAIKNINNRNIRLIIFGPVSEELQCRVDSFVDGRLIQYLGWLGSEESYMLFAASQLAVFPGRHSVYWEQVAGQGKPMICRSWTGTHHIDVGGNVIFLYDDSVEEIQKIIEDLASNSIKYQKMESIAVEKGMKTFSYREISKKSIEMM